MINPGSDSLAIIEKSMLGVAGNAMEKITAATSKLRFAAIAAPALAAVGLAAPHFIPDINQSREIVTAGTSATANMTAPELAVHEAVRSAIVAQRKGPTSTLDA
jgi:hypothetical protein